VLRGTTGAFTAANSTMVDKASGPHARLVDVAGVGTATFGGAAASGCDFLSAQAGAVTNAGPAVIGARYCYWNAADGPNPPGSGAGIAGAVDTAPYLAAPANPPTAAITSTGSQSRGVITILGTAKSPYYASAVLEVGAGTAPTVFTALAALAAPVAGGVLGYWDASSVADGTYTLRLSVTDRLGRVAQAQSVVVVSTGAPGTGDLNGNGVVDAGDAVLALRMAGGLSVASAESAAAADVRPKPGVAVPFGDGKIAMDDVAAIMAKALNPTMAWP
jgi:hypothetical protein